MAATYSEKSDIEHDPVDFFEQLLRAVEYLSEFHAVKVSLVIYARMRHRSLVRVSSVVSSALRDIFDGIFRVLVLVVCVEEKLDVIWPGYEYTDVSVIFFIL